MTEIDYSVRVDRNFNELNMQMSDGDSLRMEKLESMSVSEYYTHIETWTVIQNKKKEAMDKASKNSGSGKITSSNGPNQGFDPAIGNYKTQKIK